ncbi:hypothetical protein [uncultured Tenacibaculum sp.]|uniref:hypothetical protein n=1 Tax=uncultured Tenacibaculum sp. TaxID=174713 RepID=UPI00260BBBDD|nr:hypothetical protein [uncultured Tenacibaculum sp.]
MLGSYLVPRGYGVYNSYASDVIQIDNYMLFVPYLLFSLTIFYILSYDYIKKSNEIKYSEKKNKQTNYIVFGLYIISLFLGFPVAVQLGFLIIFLSNLDKGEKTQKLFFYIIMLVLSVKFYSFDKRNIIVVLFLIVFFETIKSYKSIRISVKNVLILSFTSILFLFLIITASINRGYGSFEDKSFKNTLTNSIEYIQSDFFIDAITDNLELNYNYGATFVALDYVDKGIIEYQYGLTLIKPLFIPIPRTIFPDKPLSFMNLYTKEYEYSEWIKGAALPVIFPVELYGNFFYLGLFVLFLFYRVLNEMYMVIVKDSNRINFKFFVSVFFVITHLFFIRGGGIDLYVLYFLFAIPTYFISKMVIRKV